MPPEEFGVQTHRLNLSPEFKHRMWGGRFKRKSPDETTAHPAAFDVRTFTRNALFNELLGTLYDSLLIADLSGTIVEANERASQQLGFSKAELLGRRVINLIDGATAQLFNGIRESAIRGRFTLIEGGCFRKDGSEFPAEITVNSMKAGDTQLLCFYFRDVTTRMEMHVRLVRLSQAVASTGDGICILDAAGRLIYQNAAFTGLCGYALERLNAVGGLAKLYVDPTVKETINRAIRDSGSWASELEIRHQDGHEVPVLLRANAIRDEEGDVLGLVCVHTDTTERRRAEAAQQQAYDQLEVRVRERTNELERSNLRLQHEVVERKKAEEELQRYARDLERSNRELEQFAYVASHDLQEPLRKIQAFGDRLGGRFGDQLGDVGVDYIERMQNAAARMQTLIHDLLTFSRVTTHRREPEAVDLSVTVADVISDLEATIEQVNGTVKATPLPTVRADPCQVRQLFQNLIENGLKFHRPNETPEVRLALEETEAQYRIRVEDNGIGFESRHAERIFTIFQRLHGRLEYEGTGIGLALCRKIVDLHGWQITAEAEPGRGATFTVAIPRPADKDVQS